MNIEREAKFYTAGFRGNNPEEAPFFKQSLIFDEERGNYNSFLIRQFNAILRKKSLLKVYPVRDKVSNGIYRLSGGEVKNLPRRLIIINASHDTLSYETQRVIDVYFRKHNWSIETKVVNTREELEREVNVDPKHLLILSQCVDRRTYNLELAEGLEQRGVVIVPGKITAPGSIFSDKDKTYKLLSQGNMSWDLVAPYRKIDVEGKSSFDVAGEILSEADRFKDSLGINAFYVKPISGGGGLGGFRLVKLGNRFILPDLSRVSGKLAEIKPVYIDVNYKDTAKIEEFFWIYQLFKSDEELRATYIKVDIKDLEELKRYIKSTNEARNTLLPRMSISREEAVKRLSSAIGDFEAKFSHRYIPLVSQHIDFGSWGFRAHLRLTCEGPIVETIYARIFQLIFSKEGIGYVGADNISNKQTGKLEVGRLLPLNEIMVKAVGGIKRINDTLYKAVRSLLYLVDLEERSLRNRVPIRVQFDLAPISGLICEGNADTARGFCLASRWSDFVRNTQEWAHDALIYYSWLKSQ